VGRDSGGPNPSPNGRIRGWAARQRRAARRWRAFDVETRGYGLSESERGVKLGLAVAKYSAALRSIARGIAVRTRLAYMGSTALQIESSPHLPPAV